MTPQTGQHVKCILRNGAIAEGIVEEWFNNVVQLKSMDGESILIITHPAEDIMLIKIILERTPDEEESVPEPQELSELDTRFEKVVASTDLNNHDSVKTLAELRIELNKQERRIIAEKLKEHRPSASPYKPSTTPYHYPSVVTKSPSAYQPGRIPNGPPRSPKKSST